MKKGSFREDLYYRLNVMQIVLPPLRERPADVPLLVELLHRRLQPRVPQEHPRRVAGGDGAAKTYRWPGNMRELRNAVERAMLLADGAG